MLYEVHSLPTERLEHLYIKESQKLIVCLEQGLSYNILQAVRRDLDFIAAELTYRVLSHSLKTTRFFSRTSFSYAYRWICFWWTFYFISVVQPRDRRCHNFYEKYYLHHLGQPFSQPEKTLPFILLKINTHDYSHCDLNFCTHEKIIPGCSTRPGCWCSDSVA